MTTHGAPTLEASGLVYEVDATRLLDQVDLIAGKGELIGLIGPNGAGKTTLLKTLSGLLRQREGSVLLAGHDLTKMPPSWVSRTLAMVPQTAPYTYGFTVMEVVLMGRYPHLGRFQVETERDRGVAVQALRMTGVEHLARRTMTTLSGGERQRVIVARALAQEPKVLLLDEPTANLDIRHQIRVLELVREQVATGLTAVAAIHDLHLAARYCHRLVLLSQGRVLATGIPKNVLTPGNILEAFQVRASVYEDPYTRALTVSVLGASTLEEA